ncbi:spermidine synthase [Pleionea litopenaei]|uniref:Fused MFS/spermidine synthase n=1 Tax=Pleionea litopenaei TaxID=3070815 RepID=A0AA51RVH6_9GAMM|nr:fused MFS/spermidine synthase [Pleionea sp. HL-JVS1]WMS88213.1 fused MFS/spermidine synthase [Pleionea sp. HL-JVS1]
MKATLLLTLAFLSVSIFGAETIHTEKSLYRNISITKEGSNLCMVFETRKENPPYQTCRDEKHPKHLVFSYTRLIMSGLIYQPKPESILVVGLGGGTLPMTLAELLPNATITSVEIDPAVIRLAKHYFDYQESEKVKTIERDARLFVKRQGIKKQTYDWVILDAFNGDYIPEHLMTQEFLQEVKAVLSPNGIVTANTFSESKLYAYESATYQSVFGTFYNLKRKHTGNRIVLATANGSLKELEEIENNADALSDALQVYGVNTQWIYNRFSTEQDWNDDQEVLTDQYSPANLLKFDRED